jgi:3-hydroxymyristoyl/3-hydroxydecanoyl-(acyl carrier protein) dehydratase
MTPFADAVVEARQVRARLPRAFLDTLCAGHFPGDPIVPGAYVAGVMADAGALIPAVREARLAIASVERCTFLAPLRPGDDVVVAVTMSPAAPAGTVHAEVRVGATCVARGRLRYA